MRTSARIALLAAVPCCLAAGAAPASAATPGFAYGVGASEVTSSAAMLWTRSDSTGPVTLQVARNTRFRPLVAGGTAAARNSTDRTVQFNLRGLPAGSTLYYRFLKGTRRSETGRFRTAPLPTRNQTIRFAWTGDADASRAPGQNYPFFNNLGERNFAVYGQMARENNQFNVNLGDTIYSDSEAGARFVNGRFQGGLPTALSVAAKWAKYRLGIALPNLQRLRGS